MLEGKSSPKRLFNESSQTLSSKIVLQQSFQRGLSKITVETTSAMALTELSKTVSYSPKTQPKDLRNELPKLDSKEGFQREFSNIVVE